MVRQPAGAAGDRGEELVVDLPDGHWVVVVLRVIDCGANRVDLGHLATTFPVYRSSPDNSRRGRLQ